MLRLWAPSPVRDIQEAVKQDGKYSVGGIYLFRDSGGGGGEVHSGKRIYPFFVR